MRVKTERDGLNGLLNLLFEGAYVVDRDRAITGWNKAAEGITGFEAHEVLGKRCSNDILNHVDMAGESLCSSSCPIVQVLSDGKNRETEMVLRHKAGHRIPVAVRIMPLRDGGGAVSGAVHVFRSLSPGLAEIQRIKELEGLAYVDPLTGLATRRFLEMQLLARFDEMRRYGWEFGVLFMDVDGFKRVNDLFGHAAGDKVLRFVAETIAANSRSFDVVGRWGGEEFVAITSNINGERLRGIADRYRALVGQAGTFFADAGEIRVTISVGATLSRSDDTPDTIMRRADELLYRSKHAGRNAVTTG